MFRGMDGEYERKHKKGPGRGWCVQGPGRDRAGTGQGPGRDRARAASVAITWGHGVGFAAALSRASHEHQMESVWVSHGHRIGASREQHVAITSALHRNLSGIPGEHDMESTWRAHGHDMESTWT